MSPAHDVVIVGGGLVGAGLAAALEPAGLEVALIEAKPPPAGADAAGWDSRVYAISPGSAAWLEACGAWERVPPARLARVEAMAIYGDGGAACLRFSAYDCGLRELATIVEGRALEHALWRRLRERERVRLCGPARCRTFERDERCARIGLEDGTVLDAALVVAADGADSWVRAQAGIAAAPQDYGQRGVVAHFAAEKPHRGTAYQWFRRDGVLALLPLPGDRVSMVWSTPEPHARELLAAAPAALAQAVATASRHALGALAAEGPAAAFPLRLQRVASLIAPRVALVGDAAHSVHPLAGQGVNLGFRDARALAAVLAARGPQRDCGDRALLRRYERARREDVLTMQFATDGLQKLFDAEAVWLARLRNAGLAAVDGLPALKTLLARRAAA
jgi:ubiquinone biosynthesis UbiH/UbiF/VisC/COQ6 family hydroxylase